MSTVGDFRRCTVCHEHGWFGGTYMNHTCKPKWECRLEWHKDDADGWGTIYASDSEEAAEKYAEHYDCEGGEYAIVSQRHQDCVVQVRKPKPYDSDDEEMPIERWSIEAETVPSYRAYKADE